MSGEADLAKPAALMAEPARAAMLVALLDGSERPASELAQVAGVSASTASEHLNRLTSGGLVNVRRAGRHRYFRLRNADVAGAVEALAAIAPRLRVDSLRAARTGRAIAYARTCYDHLAGQLGVAITDALVSRGVIGPLRPGEVGRIVTPDSPLLRTLDFDIESSRRRPDVRGCLDWTHRRPHVAGRLGAGVLTYLEEQRWIVRSRSDRSLRVEDAGRDGIAQLFGVDVTALDPAA
ncbi:ArsR/SmtB family transcription factor [Solicola gregarius]|uniref:ArsR family transcriptional regulator n=1 Tax=Solicola gregarius TaxID=2908642 RepID=A0AA46YMF7_9ACTN|nr:helix-turn-helix transcriptional regulator [Solicola gregarius]UYM07707.1 ArsR family transcriptional regulator [Solicola gregarius]